MKPAFTILILMAMLACNPYPGSPEGAEGNPFFNKLNEPVRYGEVTHEHITQYADITLEEIENVLKGIRDLNSPGFESVFVAFDNVINDLSKASSSCFMYYWVTRFHVEVQGIGGLYAP